MSELSLIADCADCWYYMDFLDGILGLKAGFYPAEFCFLIRFGVHYWGYEKSGDGEK